MRQTRRQNRPKRETVFCRLGAGVSANSRLCRRGWQSRRMLDTSSMSYQAGVAPSAWLTRRWLRGCGVCGVSPRPTAWATLPRPGGQHSPPTAETTPAHPHTRQCEVLACAPPHRPPTASAVDICRLLRS